MKITIEKPWKPLSKFLLLEDSVSIHLCLALVETGLVYLSFMYYRIWKKNEMGWTIEKKTATRTKWTTVYYLHES